MLFLLYHVTGWGYGSNTFVAQICVTLAIINCTRSFSHAGLKHSHSFNRKDFVSVRAKNWRGWGVAIAPDTPISTSPKEICGHLTIESFLNCWIDYVR